MTPGVWRFDEFFVIIMFFLETTIGDGPNATTIISVG